jgi:hypothetical protein
MIQVVPRAKQRQIVVRKDQQSRDIDKKKGYNICIADYEKNKSSNHIADCEKKQPCGQISD